MKRRKDYLINLWEKYTKFSSVPNVISFVSGRPGCKSFSLALPKIEKVIENLYCSPLSFDYSPPEGIKQLRESISMKLQNEKLKMPPKNILVTCGGQQAIDLLFKTLLAANDSVLLENRNYINLEIPILNCLAKIKTITRPINSLKNLSLENLIKKVKPKIFYLVPDFANPTGETITLEKRQLIARLAKKYNFFVAEDQAYRDLYYKKFNLLPPIAKFAPRHTVTIGTISKIIVPGLRIGWLGLPSRLFPIVLEQKKAADLLTSTFNQLIVAGFMEDKAKFQRHLIKIRFYYQKKMISLLDCLEKFMPDSFSWNKPAGGFFVWLKGPKSFNSQRFFLKAIKNGAAFMPGSTFYFRNPKKNDFRLSISSVENNQIKKGIKKLSKLL